MLRHLLGIDHLVILVRDLDKAADAYSRLGFTLSPRGQHSPHMGTANNTIMLRSDYFELLGVVRPTEHNADFRAVLGGGGEGLSGLAWATDDAADAYKELMAKGIAASAPVDFSRPVELPGSGGHTDAAFTVTRLPAGATPGLNSFVCGHHTRDAVWITELQEHLNTAQSIAEVIVAMPDPGGARAAYEALFGTERVKPRDGGLEIATGTAPLRLLEPAAAKAATGGLARIDPARPGMVALGIAVTEIEAVERSLRLGQVAAHELEGGFAAAPDQACGVVVKFSEE